MKKPVSKKKALPPWSPIVVIAVVVLILAVLVFRFSSGGGKITYSSQTQSEIQKKIDSGWVHPRATAEQMEAAGFKLPASYPRGNAPRRGGGPSGGGASMPASPGQ